MNAKKWECEALKGISDGIFLVHDGRLRAAEPVYHDFVMLAYIAHGEGVHHIGGKDIEIRNGDIFVINPDVIHSFSPSVRSGYIEIYYCFIAVEKAEEIYSALRDFFELDGFFNNTHIGYIHVEDNANREIQSLFVRMIDEFMNCPTGSRCVINSYLVITLTKIFRRYFNSMNNPVFNRNKIVDKTIRYINYNFNFGVRVCDIAEALHLSEEYLCRLFKKHTGMTIKQFIINLKIERIKDLLKNTDRNIESIAVSLNCDQTYLNRLFKKHTGMTLLNYRKKYHYKA
ncbi:MAG: helix-turn-helix transcriptional regulator [Clostridia bacterium]|nr:helix-turn-helix transcriptional regulator [Clostridia bacterium]